VDPNNGSSPRVKTTYGYDSTTGELLSQTYNDGTPTVTFEYSRAGAIDTVIDATSSSGSDKRDLVYDSTYPWRLSAEVENSFYGSRAITRLYQGSGVVGRIVGFKVGSSAGSSSELEQNYGYLANGRLETVTSTRLASSGTIRTFRYAWRTDSPLLDSLSIDGSHPFNHHPRSLLLTLNVCAALRKLPTPGISHRHGLVLEGRPSTIAVRPST
jgi:hypothetical protein